MFKKIFLFYLVLQFFFYFLFQKRSLKYRRLYYFFVVHLEFLERYWRYIVGSGFNDIGAILWGQDSLTAIAC